jgi:hypothetical protein
MCVRMWTACRFGLEEEIVPALKAGLHILLLLRLYIMYTHTHTHTYIHTYIHIYIHTYIHTYIHIQYIHTYIFLYIYLYIHTYIHTYVYIYTYIHTYIYIHIYTALRVGAVIHEEILGGVRARAKKGGLKELFFLAPAQPPKNKKG